MDKETGGSAFPSAKGWWTDDRTGEVKMSEAQEGMTLRDYFAAKFAAAWVQALAIRWKEPGCSDLDIMLEANRRGLEQADSMLEARQQQD